MFETAGTIGMREGGKRALASLSRHPHVADDVLSRYAALVCVQMRSRVTVRLDPTAHFVASFVESFRYSRRMMTRYRELVDISLLKLPF